MVPSNPAAKSAPRRDRLRNREANRPQATFRALALIASLRIRISQAQRPVAVVGRCRSNCAAASSQTPHTSAIEQTIERHELMRDMRNIRAQPRRNGNLRLLPCPEPSATRISPAWLHILVQTLLLALTAVADARPQQRKQRHERSSS